MVDPRTEPTDPLPRNDAQPRTTRRWFVVGGATTAATLTGYAWYQHRERFHHADVFIAKAESYELDLAPILRDALQELGIGPSWAKGKSVLLKPNLVEPSLSAPQINTHPSVINAAARLFRSWDAREVLVGEGQGHIQDSDWVLEQSGMQQMFRQEKLPFVDLNHDEIFRRPNRLGVTKLPHWYLPRTLKRVDRVVSVAKLKTHHWAGVTLSMKNFFGILPGICYGWPKNVLHYQGISRSIVDINAAVPADLAIVDGIIGMEGDGPILGPAKRAGVLIVGGNSPAVDATATRVMGLDPWRIDYLVGASGLLGPIGEANIAQRGETIGAVGTTFNLAEHQTMDRFRVSN